MSLQTSLAAFALWANFLATRGNWEDGVPLDVVSFFCSHCREFITLNPNGVFILSDEIEEPMSEVFNQLLTFSFEEHITETEDCPGDKFEIVDHPENLVFLFPASKNEYLQPFEIDGQKYEVDTIIHPMESEDESIFALYKKEDSLPNEYHDFVHDNFNSHFKEEPELEDITNAVEELIVDDDTANEFKHLIPRMDGGGRGLKQHYNYICRWCHQEKIAGGQAGRFLEFRNFRDHFKRAHKDVPMSDFLESVTRRDPKYYCPNCKKTICLQNVTYHKSICKNDSSTDDESDSEQEKKNDNQRATKKRKKYRRILNSSDSEDSDAGKSKRETSKVSAAPGTSTSTQTISVTSTSMQTDDQLENEFNMTVTKDTGSLTKKFRKIQENTWTLVDNVSNNNGKYHESYNCNVLEEEVAPLSDDTDNEDEVVNESNIDNSTGTDHDWWKTISEDSYCDRGYPGMKIFCKNDDEEFVTRVIQNWKAHEANKVLLDQKMEEVENSDERLKQYSEVRDELILNKFIDFVKSSSMKNVLECFSADYEENSVQVGAKATTAKNYGNRIVEFFKFMAASYDQFHLDWFTDYDSLIEKTDPNKQKTFEIFVPTKDDLVSFVKQYHYGTNPAANVGARINAIKKFLDFLIYTYKENEHRFPGTHVEKSNLVECLTQKLKNLNQNICPDGTIKKISIASNRNHKQALIEQMAQCPEKSIKNIMDGVARYLKSDDYSFMKTKLFELAYKKAKIPTKQEYMLVTNWLLEQLICLGGNRPCALLGITVGKIQYIMIDIMY